MITPQQLDKLELANLTRLQIASIKNDSKVYTDEQVMEYIKNAK